MFSCHVLLEVASASHVFKVIYILQTDKWINKTVFAKSNCIFVILAMLKWRAAVSPKATGAEKMPVIHVYRSLFLEGKEKTDGMIKLQ